MEASANRKSDYGNLSRIRSLKQIKTQTSSLHQDSWSYGHLKIYFEWMDSNGEPQRTSPGYLGSYEDRDEPDETKVYQGEEIVDFFNGQETRDLLDYYPTEKADLNITLNIEHYDGQLTSEIYERERDKWNTDLLKLYFAGEQNQNIVLVCIAGGEWIETNTWQRFNCKIYRPENPATSLEMIEAHTCDILYSSSSSSKIQFKICKNRESFKSFDESKERRLCCETNAFSGITGYKQGTVRNLRWHLP